MKLLVALICCVLSLGSVLAQEPSGEEFEAAVIREWRSQGAERRPPFEIGPERLSIRGLPLSYIIARAFEIEEYQVRGLASSMESAYYSIEATTAKPVDHSRMMGMLRKALVGHFNLRVRSEVRSTPVFALVVDKGGAKLQPYEEGVDTAPNSSASDEQLRLTIATSVDDLVRYLNSRKGPLALSRPVVDRTGIQGLYRIALTFGNTPNPDGRGGRLSIDYPFALRTELGLRLEPTSADIKFVIVEGAAKPRAEDD